MLKSCAGTIEAYAPIYQQWDTTRAIELIYNPQEILHISASTIILKIDCTSINNFSGVKIILKNGCFLFFQDFSVYRRQFWHVLVLVRYARRYEEAEKRSRLLLLSYVYQCESYGQ